MIKNVLITGTSSGIGKSCTELLAGNNFRVFACIRNRKEIQSLNYDKHPNIIPIIMDLQDEKDIESAYNELCKKITNEGLQGIVNNAAIAVGGPLEFSTMEIIKDQFDVNLFGQIRVIQRFMPLLRAGKGRIINISSNNGFLSFPYMGVYCATKFALEAISDALRLELKKWNIPVIVINPDKITSRMWQKSIQKSDDSFYKLKKEAEDAYGDSYRKFIAAIGKIEGKALSPIIVAKSVRRALNSPNPKTRYLPGFEAKITFLISKFFPKKLLNYLILKELNLK